MEEPLEQLVSALLAQTIAIQRQWAQYDETLRPFKRVIGKRDFPLDISEAQFRELFSQYSGDVGRFVGSDKNVELVIAKSWEEWVDQNVEQLELGYTGTTRHFLPLVKAAAMGQLSVQSLESHLNEEPAGLLGFMLGRLPADISFLFDMQGVTFGQRVVIDLNSFNRQVYSVLYSDYTNRGHVDNAQIRAARQFGNGFAKYLVAHEVVHGHVSEIGEMKAPVVKASRQFASDLFRMIYELGDENKQIYTALGGKPDEHATKEIYAVAIFNYAINEYQKTKFEPSVDPEQFKPLPQHVREFIASFRGQFANYVVTIVDESLADFVAEQVLRGDSDYGFFEPIYEQLTRARPGYTTLDFEVSARKAGLPLIRTLYNRFGNGMFDILKQRLPQSIGELEQPQLYIERAGFGK